MLGTIPLVVFAELDMQAYDTTASARWIRYGCYALAALAASLAWAASLRRLREELPERVRGLEITERLENGPQELPDIHPYTPWPFRLLLDARLEEEWAGEAGEHEEHLEVPGGSDG